MEDVAADNLTVMFNRRELFDGDDDEDAAAIGAAIKTLLVQFYTDRIASLKTELARYDVDVTS